MMVRVDGMKSGGGPPPAWYPDPSGRPVWRWWSGDQWSDHFAPMYASPGTAAPLYASPGTAAPLYPSPVAAEPRDLGSAAFLQGRQARLDGFIAWAPWIWVIAGIASLLVNWASIGYYRDLWHWWHALVQASDAGRTIPAAPQRPVWSSLFSLVGFGTLLVEILFLMWQYRAAQVARALRYPARHSPGWGVGCWFVPVVNLWMPYQALRDCLPSGHPARRYVLYTWILLLSVGFLGVATVVALVGAPDLGVALVCISVVAEGALGLSASRAVTAIAADHRDVLTARRPPA